MNGGKRRIDRILDPAYLAGLEGLPLADVRSRRTEVRQEESLLSYERRLLHARLDIIRGEQDRRASGDTTSLVERLPQLLADEPQQARGSFPAEIELPVLDNLRRRVERLASDDTLMSLADLTDEQLAQIIRAMEEAEAEVSEQRRSVLPILDRLTEEIGRRYRSGEARPEDVLATET